MLHIIQAWKKLVMIKKKQQQFHLNNISRETELTQKGKNNWS